MEIIEYDNSIHRHQVASLWKSIFGYPSARNNPYVSLDKKMAAGDGLLFVAVEGNRVEGTVMAGYDGHRGWIYSLAVSQDQRNKGTGGALLRHAEDKLKQKGCMKINLQVMPGNRSAVEFYRSRGYHIEERTSMGKELPENVPEEKLS